MAAPVATTLGCMLSLLLSPLQQFDLRGERLDQNGKSLQILLLLGDLPILLLYKLMQALNSRQRNTISVHCRDRRVVLAHAESRLEILRHRSDVAYRCTLRLVAPTRDRHAGDFRQNPFRVDGLEADFGIAVR